MTRRTRSDPASVRLVRIKCQRDTYRRLLKSARAKRDEALEIVKSQGKRIIELERIKFKHQGDGNLPDILK